MNQVIPITSDASQTFTIQLGNQNCQINLYQKTTGLFMDLTVNNNPILIAILCLDRVYLVREAYLGFIGNLFFVDTQGTSDPVYSGLGSRYILVYSS